MTSRLIEALSLRPLLLDAGMGTRLIELGLDLQTSDPALWNLAHPEAVAAIHARDIAAGSDVLLTNTFGANATWLDRYGRAGEMAAINRRAVSIAREAAGPDRFLLGTIGPTAGTGGTYRAQAEVLVEAGVDGLLLETHSQGAALVGLGSLRVEFDLPILVSLASWPLDTLECARGLVEAGADVLGINCVETHRARDWVQTFGRFVPVPLLWKPSASQPADQVSFPPPLWGRVGWGDKPGPERRTPHPTLPHKGGGISGDPIKKEELKNSVAPEDLATGLPDLIAGGVRLLGACCGANDAHIAALRSALDLQRSLGV